MRKQKLQIFQKTNNQFSDLRTKNTNESNNVGRNIALGNREKICHRNRDLQTQKTIQELKMSIGSIEKMIQRSQQLLRTTKPLNPRQARSDSLQLKIGNNSQEKLRSKSKTKNIYNNPASRMFQLDKLSATAVTRQNTNQQTLVSSLRENQFGSLTRLSQKQKPKRPYLFIQTQDIQEQEQLRDNQRMFANIITPTSTLTRKIQASQQSFEGSLESPYDCARRFRTEVLNDSDQRSYLGSSLQKYSTVDRNKHYLQNEQKITKRIRLKKKKNPNINTKYIMGIPQLEQNSRKPRRQWIFEQSKNITKVKPGKYSQTHQITNPNGSKKLQPDQRKEIDPMPQQSLNIFNKENNSAELDDFYKKLKQFGFVQRYLTYQEIGFIFQYLKRSQIPQHKWPLYVVDKVYEKMHANPTNLKQ